MKNLTHWTITLAGFLAMAYGLWVSVHAIHASHGWAYATVYGFLVFYALCSFIGKLYAIEESYLAELNSRNSWGVNRG